MIIETERLYLREMTDEDFSALFNIVYSCMKYTNEASVQTDKSYGCKQAGEFSDEINEITKVFAISRNEWINR